MVSDSILKLYLILFYVVIFSNIILKGLDRTEIYIYICFLICKLFIVESNNECLINGEIKAVKIRCTPG